MESYIIKGHTLEYIDELHVYLCDGIIIPSVTKILSNKFRDKYKFVNSDTLKKASILGTQTHKAIEDYCKEGKETDLKELKNFKFLQKQYEFEVVDNEIPIIIFKNDVPLCAGRLDLVLKHNDDLMLGDIKRTATLDKEYLTYQLNLYRIGYQQCYDKQIKGLKGLHLRENKRRYVDIPINEKKALELLDEFILKKWKY